MNKSWLRKLILLFILVLISDYFFLHVLFPQKRQALIQSYNAEVNQSLKKNPPPENANEISVPHQIVVNSKDNEAAKSIQNEFVKCFSNLKEVSVHNTKEVIEVFEQKIGIDKKSTDIENFHFKLKSGEERRLHLTTSDHPGISRELKLFQLDSQGLPEKIKDQDLQNPTEEQIKKILSQGEVFYHQLKQVIVYKDGSKSFVEWVNDEPKEFQFLSSTHTFSCSEESCHCL